MRKQRRLHELTEFQIQRKLERFKLHQIQERLDGVHWKAGWKAGWTANSALNELGTLLRAGVNPTRDVMDILHGGWNLWVLPSLVSRAQRWKENDVSHRNDYARKFYGVQP